MPRKVDNDRSPDHNDGASQCVQTPYDGGQEQGRGPPGPRPTIQKVHLHLTPGGQELFRRYLVVLGASLLERKGPSLQVSRMVTGIILQHLLRHASWINDEYYKVCQKVYGGACDSLASPDDADGIAARAAGTISHPKRAGDPTTTKLLNLLQRARAVFEPSRRPPRRPKRPSARPDKVRARSGAAPAGTDRWSQADGNFDPRRDDATRPLHPGLEPELLRKTREELAAKASGSEAT